MRFCRPTEYLSPRSGRHLPYDPQAADLVHRHTLLIAVDPATLARRCTPRSPSHPRRRTDIHLPFAIPTGTHC